MAKDAEFEINKKTYAWCARSIHASRKSIGLRVKVHNDSGLIEQGDIFLFNHFARFETLVPPYIIHQTSGAYCRSVADHALFEGNERLANFLRSVGAVPNTMPGLLSFLAAEILRGRKVIIFPEGGMVKDRQVMNDDGDYSVYSRTAQERRKHHRGASVLALTLEIFKRRIRTLADRGDEARINRWCKALELPSQEALLKAAQKPTAVIPSTITFYPLRIDENILSSAAELFSVDMGLQFLEELVIEGNLLLKDTDMDIRLGDPLIPEKKWSWWESLLLERYFKKITSLDDLFNLREQHVESLPEKILARCITKEAKRIRDLITSSLYTGITVNLSHLASYLIYRMVKQDRMSMDQETFHRTLYLALKNLQAVPGIHLHRSLCWPDHYRRLINGHCPELDRFMAMAKDAGLIEWSDGIYHFLPPLVEHFGFDEIRIGNPVLVYANEVAPIEAVRETVNKALLDSNTISEQDLASFLFDDELRAHDWNKKHYSQPRYSEINQRETATESGAPYLFLPKDKCQTGVLLVHGLLASPAEWQNYAHSLSQRGIAVLGVRLAGHGTSPWDLHRRKWKEWLLSIQRNYRILSAFCDTVVVVGFSVGGALTLCHASTRPEKLAGIVSINAPVKFKDRNMAFVPLVHGLNKIASWLPMVDTIVPFISNDSEHPHINYSSIPVPALFEMRTMIEDMQKNLAAIQVPALVIQSKNDPVTHSDSAQKIHGKLTTDCELKWIESARHGIITDNDDNTWTLLDQFITRMTNRDTDSLAPPDQEREA